MTTNQQIAELLLRQTYAERMGMARDFADFLNVAKAEMDEEDGFLAKDVADLIEGWAEAETQEPAA